MTEVSKFDEIAAEFALAIAVVDGSGQEVSLSNDNSICKTLNPEGKLQGKCSAFCGTALEETTEVGGPVSYTCHAGLECSAVAMKFDGKPAAVIVGRMFATTESYRKAAERARSGDWSDKPSEQLFDNILLKSSPDAAEKAVEKIRSLCKGKAQEKTAPEPKVEKAIEIEPKQIEYVEPVEEVDDDRSDPTITDKLNTVVERFKREVAEKSDDPKEATVPDEDNKAERRNSDVSVWRSFFGSLLKLEYPQATASLLDFVGKQYGLSSLIWLERDGDKFRSTSSFSEMKDRKVKLGISPDDHRLSEALKEDRPLTLGERSKGSETPDARTMNLFPIGLNNEVSAALAVVDHIENDEVKAQIVKICRAIAPQFEILRLRNEVASTRSYSNSIRSFGENLNQSDDPDLWAAITRTAAEILKAERASFLIYNAKYDQLEAKALIGVRDSNIFNGAAGERAARIVYDRGEPVVVLDAQKAGLPPAPPERQYKTSSFLSLPIQIGGRNIGVMSFTDRASGLPFDRATLELFNAISPQVTVAIDRALLKEKAGEFEQLSVTDALTGLLNRRYIEERLLEEVKRSNRHGYPMSFMMLDVDEFKSYNDRFGHPAGDQALKIVAHVIRETLRGADVAARFGGEEFSILLPQTTGEEAVTIAERIRHNIEQTSFPHRRVTASIGVSTCSAELCASKDLVDAADKALYAAKGHGRNRVLSFIDLDKQNTQN